MFVSPAELPLKTVKPVSLKSKVISNDINGLTGCLTFFRLKVENVKIFSDGSNCEDSINLINVVGSIDYLKIINSSSDGFDADFSDIRVEKIYIENSANDCTDFSFGKYEIKDIYVNGCGDKGISLGETSHLKLDKLVAKNTDIAVASKDYGKLIANDILIKDVKTCLSAYKKKQEFSGGTMILNKMKCQNFSYKMKKDQASKIKFNNNL